MGWVWGEKKLNKKVACAQTNREHVMMNNKVRVSLELNITSPTSVDIINIVENTKIDFSLPPETKIKDVRMTLCELLGRGGS